MCTACPNHVVASGLSILTVCHLYQLSHSPGDIFTHCTHTSVKTKIIEQFTSESPLRVVIATVAFGLGMNWPDIRQVIHWGLPQDAEAYAPLCALHNLVNWVYPTNYLPETVWKTANYVSRSTYFSTTCLETLSSAEARTESSSIQIWDNTIPAVAETPLYIVVGWKKFFNSVIVD